MTQLKTVAQHILKYGHITRNEAIGIYGITRLAALMHVMSSRGVPVIAESVLQGKRRVDFKYTYRTDYLERLQAITKAINTLEKFKWNTQKPA